MTYDVGSDIVARYIDHFRTEFKLDFRKSKTEVMEVMNERIRYLEKIGTLQSVADIAQIQGFQKGLWEKSNIWSQIQERTSLHLIEGKYYSSYDKWEPEQVEFIRDRLDLKDTLLRDRLNRTYGTYHTLSAIKRQRRRISLKS